MSTTSTMPSTLTGRRKIIVAGTCFVLLAIVVAVTVRWQQSAADRRRNFQNALTEGVEAGQDRIHAIREEINGTR